MNTPFNISQWLKQQTPTAPPRDDFDAIYQQVKPVKSTYRGLKAWTIAAGIALMAVGLAWIYQPSTMTENADRQLTLSQLQQRIYQLEHTLNNHQHVIASDPGSSHLENRVLLEQWLKHLNGQLATTQNPLTQQNLLQAKLSVLQSLTPKQTIQLI